MLRGLDLGLCKQAFYIQKVWFVNEPLLTVGGWGLYYKDNEEVWDGWYIGWDY